ncbi:MAG: hypothetical protein K6D96_06680 [Acetatifactor sp.]|nr:hypothetical protein [Acetatifactor sp.]
MKAVVVEVKNSISSVLREDGVFENIKAELTLGETIDTDKYKKKSVASFKPAYRIAAAAAAVFVLFGGTYSQTAYASSYITVDADSSIELALNNMGRVISVEALDDDSKALVEELYEQGIRFDSVEEAIKKTREIMNLDEYENNDETVIIDIASDNEKKIERISERVKKSYEGLKEPEMFKSTLDDRAKARENNVSTGQYKYDMVNTIEEQTSDIKIEEDSCANMENESKGNSTAPESEPAEQEMESVAPESKSQEQGSNPAAPESKSQEQGSNPAAPESKSQEQGSNPAAPESKSQEQGSNPAAPENKSPEQEMESAALENKTVTLEGKQAEPSKESLMPEVTREPVSGEAPDSNNPGQNPNGEMPPK